MINIRLCRKELRVKFFTKDYPLFLQIKSIVKNLKFVWNPNSKEWSGSPYKYDELIESLSDIDMIEDQVDKKLLNDITAGIPEQEFENTRRIPDYSLMNFPPMEGKGSNKNFQDEGIKKGINRSRYAYFWEMGTGKSYIASAIIAHRLLKYHDVKKVLFLTTSIGVRNLKYELKKFIKDLDISRVSIGDKNNRLPFKEDVDIVISSYNSFRLICDAYRKEKGIDSQRPRKPFLPLEDWFNGEEGMLILDESHEIMNKSSQRGYLVNLHAKSFKYRYLFSGTPADQPEKLYNQLTVLDPWLTYGLSFEAWKDKMAYIGTRFSQYAVREWKQEELEKSNKRFLEKHGNFFKSKEVIDLPEYIERKIYLDMKPYHRDLYQRVVMEDFRDNINKNKTSVRDFVNRFPYLMLSVDNPELLKKHKDKFSDDLNILIDKFKSSYMEKFDAIDDIIEAHPGEKILIWAIHPLTINQLGKRYEGLNPICITGETPQEERNSLVEEFKTGNHKLLIANIATLNTSVTITDVTCQIYIERGFNYSNYEQSTRRIYRIGQDKPVISYILIYENTLDVLTDKNLSSKGMLVDGLLSKNFLTQEQWSEIFNLNSSDTNF